MRDFGFYPIMTTCSSYRPTITIEKNGNRFKLCKLWFGSDGSCYLAVPYHPANKALLLKSTVNYNTRQEIKIHLEQCVDVCSLDDRRLKLSLHPDGFCQFSGDGVVSGKDDRGEIRGIGVWTHSLLDEVSGPRFGVSIQGIESFAPHTEPSQDDVRFRYDDFVPVAGSKGLALECYYFQPRWRRFIYAAFDGTKVISVPHVYSRATLNLRVLPAPDDCALQGFIGLDLFPMETFFKDPGFCINGPAENWRSNLERQHLGELIWCMYPRPEKAESRRSLNFIRPEP